MMGFLTKKRQDTNLGLGNGGLVWFCCFVSKAPTVNSDSSPGLTYKLCIWNGHRCVCNLTTKHPWLRGRGWS